MNPDVIIHVLEPATEENFNEEAYLRANPDVAKAIAGGMIESGLVHFRAFGYKEGRQQMDPKKNHEALLAAKRNKQERIQALFKEDLQYQKLDGMSVFLSDEIRKTWNITDTDAVSQNLYDDDALNMIERHANGFVLDMGAGNRMDYYKNVINYEIVPYDSTDVLGVGEELPFKDGSIDAVFSSAVLEHVKDPFRCAKEIIRVLKPGGELICCVPFLQPYHGYPHHYYNMTHQGLRNLFEGPLVIDKMEVLESTAPIHTLTWILESWSKALPETSKEQFLNMKVRDLLAPVEPHLNKPYVTELPMSTRFELASATVLFAHRPIL